jgi:hypothetical protein
VGRNPLARSPADTMQSAGGSSRRGLDPPTRPLPIAVIAAPPPPPAPQEEATRQMSVASILADEITRSSLSEPTPSRPPQPASAPTSQAPSQSTMALTPEQAAAMLASAGRHATPHGGFPEPLARPPMVAPAVEDVDTSGETFALTPEQAQRMIAEAQAKNRR